MAEHFWIQGEDGKMEGSLPGVPKQGNGQDAAKQSKQLNPFLAKLRKKMENRRKNRTPIDKVSKGEDRKVAESVPEVSNNGNEGNYVKKNEQPISFLDKLRKRMEEKRKKSVSLLVKKAYDIGRAEQGKMHQAYDDLYNDGLSTEGVDKYYHSVAHCKIARLGYTGVISSHALGMGKEALDILKENFEHPNASSIMAKGVDSAEDMQANAYGRDKGINGDPSKSCEELCNGQWPAGIPEKYKR